MKAIAVTSCTAGKSARIPAIILLKRPAERHLTMQAFDSPIFVEDVIRNAVTFLKMERRIQWFNIRAVNQESIHNHSAFAVACSA